MAVQTIPAREFEQRLGLLASTSAAWSPVCCCPTAPSQPEEQGRAGRAFAVLAVGTKAGRVWLWRYWLPQHCPPGACARPPDFELVRPQIC